MLISIKKQHIATHNLQVQLEKILIENTHILYKSHYPKHLAVREAMYFKYTSPNKSHLIPQWEWCVEIKIKIETHSDSSCDQHVKLGINGPTSVQNKTENKYQTVKQEEKLTTPKRKLLKNG